MRQGKEFKGRQFTAEVILWAVRWYLMFPISYRDLELMLQDRGVEVDHTTLFRWIQAYAPELEKRIRPHLHRSNGSWRVDETYVKVKGRWTYLYRAVDSRGQTIDFLLSAKRDAAAAKRFFRKALGQPHTGNPRTITVDKNAAYPAAVSAMKREGELWRFSRLRQVKYLNNIVEQDHRRIKRLVRPGLGFGSLSTARRTLAGYEGFVICASLVRQFEFAQNVWINDPNFHELGNERDPLIGNQDGTFDITIPKRPIRKKITGLPAFTTVKGGAYFFLPGIKALHYLAGRGESSR